jgi:DNA polymerase IV
MAGEEAAARKKLTFDALYAIDDTSDDEDLDHGLSASINALKGKTLGDPTVPTPVTRQPSTLSRSLSTPFPPRTTSAQTGRNLITRARDSADVVKETPIPSLQVRHTITGIEALKSTNVPSSISAPLVSTPPVSAVPRATGKRRRDADIKLVSDELQLFRGLHFYFFPNDDINPSRRNRIIKALEYGATWQKNWNNAVTHVVVDSTLNYNYLKLKVKGIPVSV